MVSKDEIINFLEQENEELKLRVAILENIADKMNDYISDNNLKHQRFISDNCNCLNYDDYKNMQVITIPRTTYIVIPKEGE